MANWPEKRVEAWDILLRARAIENMAYCIGLNRTGEDGDGYIYNGHTGIYDCLGAPLIEENREREFVKEACLDKAHLQDHRNHLKFLQDRDSFTLN